MSLAVKQVCLASGSPARAAMLKAAGLDVRIQCPSVDEEAIKMSLRAEGLVPRDQADALAEAKALSVSRRVRGFVIGADQMLSCEGDVFDKPASAAEARAQLEALSGRAHVLHTAAVIAVEGAPIWRYVAQPRLHMRTLSPGFIDDYLEAMGESVTDSVGAYKLEGIGAQLFSEIDGDYFSILGLPLLPLLAFLREHGIVGR